MRCKSAQSKKGLVVGVVRWCGSGHFVNPCQLYHFANPSHAELQFAGPVVPFHSKQRVKPGYRCHVLQTLKFETVVRTFDGAVCNFAVWLQSAPAGRSQPDLVKAFGQHLPASMKTCMGENCWISQIHTHAHIQMCMARHETHLNNVA